MSPSPRDTSFAPSFAYLARQKYDLILGIGFLQQRDVDAAALRFPAQKFAYLDGRRQDLRHRPKNVRGTLFKTEEPAYLAGYLAALLEKRRPGKDVVATVGGIKIPTVDTYIAGFQAGARKADPGITALNAYSRDFVNQEKCATLARSEIARGAGVVFAVAGGCGVGALDAAAEAGVWAVGVDIDQSYLGPHILTSVVKRLDVAVVAIVRSLVDGTFTTGTDTVFGLKNGGVGLGRISSNVPRRFVRALDAIRAQIVAGKIHVPSALG